MKIAEITEKSNNVKFGRKKGYKIYVMEILTTQLILSAFFVLLEVFVGR
jgi:hypothetical protein